jgi:hypothetical protein
MKRCERLGVWIVLACGQFLDAEAIMRSKVFLLACFTLGYSSAQAGFFDDLLGQIQAQQTAQQQAAANAGAELKKKEAAAKQADLDEIEKRLDQVPETTLWSLRAAPDVCADPAKLPCKSVNHATVKPFVEIAFEKRKITGARIDNQNTLYVSMGSLAVSFLSLLIAGYSARQKKKENSAWPATATNPAPAVPSEPPTTLPLA